MYQYSASDAKLRDDLARAHDNLISLEPKGVKETLGKWASLLFLTWTNNRRLDNIHSQVNYFRTNSGMKSQSYATTLLMDQLATNRGEDYDRMYADWVDPVGPSDEFEPIPFDTTEEDARMMKDQEDRFQRMRDERDEAIKYFSEESSEDLPDLDMDVKEDSYGNSYFQYSLDLDDES